MQCPGKKSLAEVCPQCCKLIDSSACRLVYDTCGHLKCRICLLQEIAGCLLCTAEHKSLDSVKSGDGATSETQPRKSVITSVALQKAEQKTHVDNGKTGDDKETCHLIKQTLEKDILFPTDIVKRSTGNFYHLKRIFSQRFFNEDNVKRHKCTGDSKEKQPPDKSDVKKCRDGDGENIREGGGGGGEAGGEGRKWSVPSHIQIQYYCTIHKMTLEESTAMKHHMSCRYGGDKSEVPLYKCEICDRGYRALGKLNRHKKVHTKTSRFKCLQCGKPCTDNYALKTHERTHTEVKPYSCSYCDKKFSGQQNFKRHEKKHRNEKTFVCNDCGFQFITRTELKRHAVTHTNVKAFACSICSSRFAFKRTLMRHVRTHDANLTKLKCPMCESTFRRKDNLERHIKSAHQDLKTEKDDSNRMLTDNESQ